MNVTDFKLLVAGISVIVASCGSDSGGDSPLLCRLPAAETSNQIIESTITTNPFGMAPLTALLDLTIRDSANVRVTLKGKNGTESDITTSISSCEVQYSIPLVGLYPDFINEIGVEILNNGTSTAGENYVVITDPLPDGLPTFEVLTDYQTTEAAFFLVNFRPTGIPLVVDRWGEIRWFLDFPGVKFGLQRLRNGNFAFGLLAESRIEEYSVLGELLNTWTVLPDFAAIHHDVFEMDNGNFLVTVNKEGIDTVEDFIVEVDRITGDVITVWDLREILPRRTTFFENEIDWFHSNAVIHDPRDDTIIISGQRQGVVKVSRDNELRWILAPPDGWDGFEDYLLTITGSSDFEWNWGQHAPLLLPSGDLLLFDNGFGREYGSGALYSRAVQYRINENTERGGTVEQIWQYGKGRSDQMYAPIISDVDFLPEQQRVLITAGSLALNLTYVAANDISFQWVDQQEKARIIEVDFDGIVAFEMLVMSQIVQGSVYRSEKLQFFGGE